MEFTGTLVSSIVLKEGFKEGKAWKLSGYTFKAKNGVKFVASGFILPEKYIGQDVKVTYQEKENPKDADEPYKNVSKIEFHGPPATEEEVRAMADNYKEPREKTEKTNPQFFGMIFNKTCDYLNAHQSTYDLKFSEVFEKLWKLAKDKRKEKGL